MSQEIRSISPFLIFNSVTQSLQLFSQPSNNDRNRISFVSLIQVKNKDYKAIVNSQALNSLTSSEFEYQHGIYISDQIYSAEEQRHIRYLILPTNEGNRVHEKYQDLFSSLLIILSNVCVFDISSKHLRSSHTKNKEKQTQRDKEERFNYVIMNTKGGNEIGEVYKVNMQNYTNKLEIANKIGNNSQGNVLKEFMKNVRHSFNMSTIQNMLREIIEGRVLWKNYLNFEEIQLSFLATLKLHEYLEQKSKQYVQLTEKKQKLSIVEFQDLQNWINEFRSVQFYTSQQILILQHVKKVLKGKLRTLNKGLNQKFLLNLKNQYFLQVTTFGQLFIKRELAQKILEQYGIVKNYGQLLYSEVENKIQFGQIKRLNGIIQEKQQQIRELEKCLQTKERMLVQTTELLAMYEDKNMDFKKINEKYQQKCIQLERQRYMNMKQKQEIEKLLIEQRSKKQSEENLHKYIIQILETKNNQQNIILSLKCELQSKQKFIEELSEKIKCFEDKIKYHHVLENKYEKIEENNKNMKDELERYKGLLENLERHFEAFKRAEIQKFNHVLKKNYEQYSKIRIQSEQKGKIIKSQEEKINRLHVEIQEEKSRLKFCQDQVHSFLENKENRGKVNDWTEQGRESLTPCASEYPILSHESLSCSKNS